MINEFRAQHREYDDMSDSELADALHRKYYRDMPKSQFDAIFIGRPNHDDLNTAAVTAEDSLDLQNADPEVKPVIVGTAPEVLALKKAGKIGAGKEIFQAPQGKVYVIDAKAVQGIYGASLAGSVKMAKMDLLKGNDAHLLGYPQKGPADMVVTKQGEIVTNLPRMSDEAKAGNLAYGASGQLADLMKKAEEVSQAAKKGPRKWKEIGTKDDLQQGTQAAQMKNLKPAVSLDGKVLHGGDTHNEILDAHRRDRAEGERGFTAPSGQFLSREEGMQYLSQHQPDIHQQMMADGVDELHSEDLLRAYK